MDKPSSTKLPCDNAMTWNNKFACKNVQVV